ncbi:hypothetical protein V1289_001775 [Bradyrhizobium sp. AZCC 2289]
MSEPRPNWALAVTNYRLTVNQIVPMADRILRGEASYDT